MLLLVRSAISIQNKFVIVVVKVHQHTVTKYHSIVRISTKAEK